MNEITIARMAAIFNEWARRFSEKPDEFKEILDADGKADASYGEGAAHYFNKIAEEMDAAGVLPRQ